MDRIFVIVVRQVGSRVIWSRTGVSDAGFRLSPEEQLSAGTEAVQRRSPEEVQQKGLPYWEFANRLEGRT